MSVRDDTALAVYQSVVRSLPVLERLRLAPLIMDDRADSAPAWIVLDRDEWSDDDVTEVRRASMVYPAPHLTDDDGSERR